MIHKIKSMHSDGNGLSVREICRVLHLSRNTVRKYLRMPEHDIALLLEDPLSSKTTG